MLENIMDNIGWGQIMKLWKFSSSPSRNPPPHSFSACWLKYPANLKLCFSTSNNFGIIISKILPYNSSKSYIYGYNWLKPSPTCQANNYSNISRLRQQSRNISEIYCDAYLQLGIKTITEIGKLSIIVSDKS